MTAPRVIFARTGAIGNALAAVPALRALRKARPEAFIALILEPASSQALAGCPYVDEILVYDKRGADSGLDGWLRMAFQMRKRRFTHAILSKRFLRMSLLAFLSGASVRVGFEGFGFAINRAVKWNPKEHVVKTNLDLLAALGITPCGYDLEIWPTIEDKESAEQFLKDHNLLNHPFTVAIHPGGVSHHGYLWPIENFVKLAECLDDAYSAAPIFLGGPQDARELETVARLTGGKYPICDRLNIRAAAHLISRCRIFIGSDSAPSHLACAVGTPEIIYYDIRPDREECIARWFPLTGAAIAAGPVSPGKHITVTRMMEYVEELMEKIEKARR